MKGVVDGGSRAVDATRMPGGLDLRRQSSSGDVFADELNLTQLGFEAIVETNSASISPPSSRISDCDAINSQTRLGPNCGRLHVSNDLGHRQLTWIYLIG